MALLINGKDHPNPKALEKILLAVERFARAMGAELITPRNITKEHWSNCSDSYLASRLVEESGELLRLIDGVSHSEPLDEELRLAIRKEAVDVANFAMFIADNYNCLH